MPTNENVEMNINEILARVRARAMFKTRNPEGSKGDHGGKLRGLRQELRNATMESDGVH